MSTNRRGALLRDGGLHVDAAARPGWVLGSERDAVVGEVVFTAEGPAEVVRILGKTSTGCRLLELRLEGQPRRAFFAACSNVLVSPSAG
jgi:hypothetical protein